MNIKTRRVATVIKVGDSSTVIITSELNSLGINNGEEVVVTTKNGRIEIEKVTKK